jgi:cell wall-associated NlpC family hydrolase
MNISKYLGLPYDINSVHGVNCWTLVALVYKKELQIELSLYAGKTNSTQDIADEFKDRLAAGDHGFDIVDSPINYDLVIFNNDKSYHCGIYWNRKVLHANGQCRTGSVWHDKIRDIEHNNVRFLRYAGNKTVNRGKVTSP